MPTTGGLGGGDLQGRRAGNFEAARLLRGLSARCAAFTGSNPSWRAPGRRRRLGVVSRLIRMSSSRRVARRWSRGPSRRVGRDGIKVQARVAFTLHDPRRGPIVRHCYYQDKAQALEAAGGVEWPVMSQEKVETVLRASTAFNRGDCDGAVRAHGTRTSSTSDPPSAVPSRGIYRRPRRVHRGVRTDRATLGLRRLAPMSSSEFDRRGRCTSSLRARCRPRDAEAASRSSGRSGSLWTVRDGKVRRGWVLSGPRRGPRSRRAVGVGDVA